MVTDRVRTAALAAALVLSGAALTVAIMPSSAPWQALAESRGVELEYRVLQLSTMATQYRDFAGTAVQDEHAKFSDALRLLQNLGQAVEQVLTPEQLENAAVAEAIEQAKNRIKGWTE